MKCHPVNNIARTSLVCSLFLMSFTAAAAIENTVYADYNLATGESVHHTVILDSNSKQSTVTLVLLDTNASTPSIFKVTACIHRRIGSYTQGEMRLDTVQTDGKDTRAVNLSRFTNEHNLSMWWTSIGHKMTLIHTRDPSGIFIIDPDELITNASKCASH